MDIQASFLHSLIASRHSFLTGPQAFLGRVYPVQEDSFLFHVLSGGCLQCTSPFSFDIRSLDCHMLLYTTRGCGKLFVRNEVQVLSASSLLFFDCRERFRLEIASEPWHYQIFLIKGEHLSDYYSLLPKGQLPLMNVIPYSRTALSLEQLLRQGDSTASASRLILSNLLHNIITDFLTSAIREEALPHAPSAYLRDIRALFDDAFQDSYSLDALSARFGISKYTLCKEFRSAFQSSPLQYLNKRRIEMACHLLLTSNCRIHEVGSMVGIDNTNHFIYLFKKFTSFTPLEYRQRMA